MVCARTRACVRAGKKRNTHVDPISTSRTIEKECTAPRKAAATVADHPRRERRGTGRPYVRYDSPDSGVIRPFLQTLPVSLPLAPAARRASRVVPQRALALPPRRAAYFKQVTCQRNGASLAAPGTTVRQVKPRADWPTGVKPGVDWPAARLRRHVGLISFTVGALAFSLSYLGRSVGRSVGGPSVRSRYRFKSDVTSVARGRRRRRSSP